MLVYLDNCCYNRPYDDQSQLRISLESQAKLHVQEQVRLGRIELASSYILDYEHSFNPFPMRKLAIREFLDKHTTVYVCAEHSEQVKEIARSIMETGVKTKDAYHVACAIYAGSDVFLTTDKRLLRYRTDAIELTNPVDFISRLEDEKHA